VEIHSGPTLQKMKINGNESSRANLFECSLGRIHNVRCHRDVITIIKTGSTIYLHFWKEILLYS